MKKFIFLSLIILFLSKTQNVFANQDNFTVDNIIISGEIRNNNYRNQYIESAFRKGFQKLTENILQKKDQKKILSTELKVIKSLIENYSIKEEIKVVDEKVKPIFKLFGIGKEFTVEDKIIYLVSYIWFDK